MATAEEQIRLIDALIEVLNDEGYALDLSTRTLAEALATVEIVLTLDSRRSPLSAEVAAALDKMDEE